MDELEEEAGPRSHAGLKNAGCILGIVLLLAATAWAYSFVLLFRGGELPRNQWPRMVLDMSRMAGSGRDIQVASLGAFIDSAFAFRLGAKPDRLAEITSTYGLVPVESTGTPDAFWEAFPQAWRPTSRAGQRFFASPDFRFDERGPDGDQTFLMYDPQGGELYVILKRNF